MRIKQTHPAVFMHFVVRTRPCTLTGFFCSTPDVAVDQTGRAPWLPNHPTPHKPILILLFFSVFICRKSLSCTGTHLRMKKESLPETRLKRHLLYFSRIPSLPRGFHTYLVRRGYRIPEKNTPRIRSIQVIPPPHHQPCFLSSACEPHEAAVGCSSRPIFSFLL